MKVRRWWLIVGWFVVLYLWQMWAVWSAEASSGYNALRALGRMTTPLNLLLSAVVVVLILRWGKRKPLADR